MTDQSGRVELAHEAHRALRVAAQKLRDLARSAEATNDPFATYFDALAISAEFQFKLCVDVTRTLNAVAERANRPLDMPAFTEAVTNAARGAFYRENEWQRQQAADNARVAARRELRRAVWTTSGWVALGVILTGLGVYHWHNRQMAALEDAQTGLVQEAFADGREDAGTWAALMAYNHVRDVLGTGCRQVVIDGRRGCDTRVWLDPPPRPGHAGS